MKKRVLAFMFILVAFSIIIFHYRINFNNRIKPPSEKWSKEVLISSGIITDNPVIIEHSGNYLIAHNDGNSIKLVSVDNLGNKIKEKEFMSETDNPKDISVLTDEENIYINWISTQSNGTRIIKDFKLDDDFNIIEESKINDVNEKIQIDKYVMAILYKDKIQVINIKTGNINEVKDERTSLLSGVKYGDTYYISYIYGVDEFKYFTVKNDVISEVKLAAKLRQTARVSIFNTALNVNNEKEGYIIASYRNKGAYGGNKLIRFSLEEEKYTTEEMRLGIMIPNFSSIVSVSNDKEAVFLANYNRIYNKKYSFSDITEIIIEGKEIKTGNYLSRSKQFSIYPSSYGDSVIFCDEIGGNKKNLYMVSKNRDFKEANNYIRLSEYIHAIKDTLESLMFSIVYVLPYGSLWILPSICLVLLTCLLEYRLSKRQKGIAFISIYFISTLIKLYFIYSISFKKFGYFLSNYITIESGVLMILMISILSCIYGFRKYMREAEYKVMPLSFTCAIFLDAVLVQMFFVSFIK